MNGVCTVENEFNNASYKSEACGVLLIESRDWLRILSASFPVAQHGYKIRLNESKRGAPHETVHINEEYSFSFLLLRVFF